MTTESIGGTAYRSVNPATGERLAAFDTMSDDEIGAAIAAAVLAYNRWRDQPVAERVIVLGRIADGLRTRAVELAALARLEMGKMLEEGIAEVQFSADIFDYYATEGPELLRDQPLNTQAGRAVIQRRALGTVLGIMPWNYPYYQVARFVAPNLLVGNVTVLKHSEICPQAAIALAGLIAEASAGAGVFTNVFADHAQVERLIADRRVVGVSFTGSERGGAAVAEIAGRHLKKVVLELGGSDPFIVLDSDDVAAAAADAWAMRMENNGQACNSNKRMIVMEEIYDRFVKELTILARAAEAATVGGSVDEPGFAPLSSRVAAERLRDQVDDAVRKGAVLHAGGNLLVGPGAYFTPAVLTGVVPGMRAYREELFGPVAVVYRITSAEEAIDLANDSDYGLGGAVFSRDTAAAAGVADALEVGMASVNAGAAEGAEFPFGGVKRSGFGRELGPLGVDEFVNKRLFYVHGSPDEG